MKRNKSISIRIHRIDSSITRVWVLLLPKQEYFKCLDRYRFNVSGDPSILKRAYGEDSQFRKDLSSKQFIRWKYIRRICPWTVCNYVRSDNSRKIPSGVDGLKTVQRKILYTFIKKYKSEQKVAQMAGIIAKETQYHSGEDNISKAIINMAQDFVGSNNLPLLKPNGQFGTRNCGGSDSAAPRYINTEFAALRIAYIPEADLPVLEYNSVDGHVVEPVEFVPIIPMVLVNGVCGLGTGWVSQIPSYNPLDLIQVYKSLLSGCTPKDIFHGRRSQRLLFSRRKR